MDMGPGNMDRYAVGYTGPPAKGPGWRDEDLARVGVRAPGTGGFTAEEVRAASPSLELQGRLPDSGPGMDSVRVERNRDYRADDDLVFGRGGTEFRTRFTAGDRSEVIAALGESHLRAWQVMEAVGLGLGRADLWAMERVVARLRGDVPPPADGLVLEHLKGLLGQRLEAERAQPDSVRAMRASHLTQAVRDVITMLGGE